MPKYLIADFIVELNFKYENSIKLAEPFLYSGDKPAEISLNISDEHIDGLLKKMVSETSAGEAENFSYSSAFNKAIIKHNAMLVHSSAIIFNGKAVLFSAASQVGKSTHTKLWKKAFGDEVEYINDDKPVVRIIDNKCIAYGTPFDGGSGIANNISAPLKAVVFIERAKENSIQKISSTADIIQRLYFSTAHFVSRKTADSMLANFENLINNSDFYLLRCNTDISSAYIAKNALFSE